MLALNTVDIQIKMIIIIIIIILFQSHRYDTWDQDKLHFFQFNYVYETPTNKIEIL